MMRPNVGTWGFTRAIDLRRQRDGWDFASEIPVNPSARPPRSRYCPLHGICASL